MYTVSKQNLSILDGSFGEIILRGAPGHHFFYRMPYIMASGWFLLTFHFCFEQGLSVEEIDSKKRAVYHVDRIVRETGQVQESMTVGAK